MSSRKTQFGFMALGCLVGLLGVFAIHKMLGASKAVAGDPTPDRPVAAKPAEKPAPVQALGDPAAPLPLASPLPEPAKSVKVEVHEKTRKAEGPVPAPIPPPLPGDLPPLPPAAPANLPPPLPGKVVEPPPPAVPEPAPADPTPPAPEPKASVPPPLPSAASVPPPPNELKPIPLPPPSAAPPSGLVPVGLPVPGPVPSAPPSVLPTPVEAPVGTPLPPVTSAPPEPMTKAAPSAEPPLAPSPGPVVVYQVRGAGETMREIARRTLGAEDRWPDVHRLNPSLQPDSVIGAGATVKLPADACVRDDDAVQPLPTMRPKAAPHKPKAVLPLTGTFAANLDDKKTLLLPRAIRDQLGNCETLLVTPGSDQCLWITNQTHLDRLADRLDHSPARELDVRTFKRLYFAQTEKAAVGDDGRVTLPDKLTQFAGLRQELMLIGIDDHFEVWDAGKWRQYTQQKSAAARAAMADRD